MKKVKCVICLSQKGKRLCKINNDALICPGCCAKNRNPACEGCHYYTQAEKYSKEKETAPKSEHFIARIDPEVEEIIDSALGMIERGKIMVAEGIINGMYEKNPDLHIVQYAMGVVQIKKERYEEGIKFFDKAIKIFPFFVEAWFNKGACSQQLLDIEGMIVAFRKVMELGDPKESFVSHARSMLDDLEKGVLRDAGISLDEYLEAKHIFDAAFIKMQNSQWEEALAGFEKTVAINSTHTQSYGNMGICFAKLNRKQEALLVFDKALELDPNYEPALLNREIVSQLEDGEPLPDGEMRTMEYYKDYGGENKSLIKDFLKNILPSPK